MSEVSCRVCTPILEAVEATGSPLEPLVEGLSFTLAHLRLPSERVGWDDYAVFLERAARALGGPAALERLGAEHRRDPEVGLLRALARSFVSVRPVYQLGAKWYGPSLFSCTRATLEDLPGGRIRQTIEILPNHRHSPEFFEMMAGFLRTTPLLLGLPRATVEMEVFPGRAIYIITLPRSVTLAARMRRFLSRRVTTQEALSALTFQQHQLGEALDRAQRAGKELGEKSRQLETLNRLGRELARQTDVARLADAVMKVFVDYFEFAAVELWLMPAEGGDFELLHRIGRVRSEPARRHVLRMGTRVVGRLDLWEGESRREAHTRLLEELFPWLALALDNARAFTALQRQTQRLEREMNDRRRAEAQLQQAQKMDAVGRLAGGLAHDLNNTLTAIGGYAELARENLPAGSPADADLDEIIAEGERAAGLIKQLLAFSRRQMTLPERVDVSRTVRDMERMLTRLLGETIALEVDVAEDLGGAVLVDPGQLEQIVVNLVSNSRDAMPDGGTITISTAAVQRDGADWVRLEVRDDGIGMDSDTRSQVFEPFFTTKPRGKGTGLGLSAVYGIVTQSGGTIDVESEPGCGTTLRIELPCAEGEPQGHRLRRARGEAPSGKETLLLVEDEANVRSVMRRILERSGYAILEAADGKAALAISGSHPGPIDLVVTDVVMPCLDGRELAGRLAQARPEIRGVIYVSGYANDDVPGEGPLPLERAFLRKPFSPPALLRSVRAVLDA